MSTTPKPSITDTIPENHSVDVLKTYWKGEQVKQDEHEANEVRKSGTYRVGSGGAVLSTGHVIGTCPRKAYLRFHGINWEERDPRDYLMMENGVWNEDIWVDVLKRVWSGIIKTEEECAIEFTLTNGTRVTGRPDVMLCDAEGKYVKGLELKNASSVWTGRDVASERSPKMEHLIQAGVYMWQTGVPFDLCYASRVKYAVPTKNWIERLFPRQGDPGSELLEYNDKGGTKALLPFVVVYPLRLTLGVVEYYLDAKWWPTPVTMGSVLQYFEGLSTMETSEDLPIRPSVLKLSGDKGYDPCNPDYCGLATICTKYESKGKTQWLDAVTVLARQLQSGKKRMGE